MCAIDAKSIRMEIARHHEEERNWFNIMLPGQCNQLLECLGLVLLHQCKEERHLKEI